METVHDYLNKIGEYALLTAEEEQEILTRAVDGDKEAQKMIVHANQRFIASVANQYQDRGLSLLKLFNVAEQGLTNAIIDSASRPLNQKFIQFAVPFMRRAIENAISALNENNK